MRTVRPKEPLDRMPFVDELRSILSSRRGFRYGSISTDLRDMSAPHPTPDESLRCREVAKRTADRDRGAPRGAAPPTPPGIRFAYHGGSTGLSFSAQCRVGAARERRRHGCAVPFEPPDVLTFARTPSVNRQRPQQGTSGRLC